MQTKSNSIIQIGRELKSIRVSKGKTVQTIAEKSGITKGMLSRIENGRTVPSLPVVLNLIQSLDYEIGDFFKAVNFDLQKDYLLSKKEDRLSIEKEYESTGFSYFNCLTTHVKNSSVEINILKLAPNCKRNKVTTDAFELKYIIKGTIEYCLDKEVITLNEGDILFYNGLLPHVPINKSNVEAEILVVYFFN